MKNKSRYIKSYQFLLEYVYLICGAFIIAVGVNLFLLPNKMTTGGTSGIATILFYLFKIPMGISTLLINIPLFLISISKLGKKFTIRTIISTIFLSVFLDTFKFEGINNSLNLDLIISCILGGISVGIGFYFCTVYEYVFVRNFA